MIDMNAVVYAASVRRAIKATNLTIIDSAEVYEWPVGLDAVSKTSIRLLIAAVVGDAPLLAGSGMYEEPERFEHAWVPLLELGSEATSQPRGHA